MCINLLAVLEHLSVMFDWDALQSEFKLGLIRYRLVTTHSIHGAKQATIAFQKSLKILHEFSQNMGCRSIVDFPFRKRGWPWSSTYFYWLTRSRKSHVFPFPLSCSSFADVLPLTWCFLCLQIGRVFRLNSLVDIMPDLRNGFLTIQDDGSHPPLLCGWHVHSMSRGPKSQMHAGSFFRKVGSHIHDVTGVSHISKRCD